MAADGDEVLSSLTGAHWAILGAALVALILLLIVNGYARSRRRRNLSDAKDGLVTAEFLTLKDLPRHAYDIITAEAIRERGMEVVPDWDPRCGWGAPGTEHAGVKFKAFIASSLRVLEQYALRRDAGLAAGVDVADYMARLRAAVPELDADLCRQYVAFYRSARAPGRVCTEREYHSFVPIFLAILRCVER